MYEQKKVGLCICKCICHPYMLLRHYSLLSEISYYYCNMKVKRKKVELICLVSFQNIHSQCFSQLWLQ